METEPVFRLVKGKSARQNHSGTSSPLAKVLVADIGGTNVKLLATGQTETRKVGSGPALTPGLMMSKIKALIPDWDYDAVSIGYPGPVLDGRPVAEPHNLGKGWVGFDFEAAFGRPVRIVNDAAMQALGSYQSGKLLFLGLGTGLGSAMILDGIIEPMELGHLPYKKGTFEDYVGQRGLERNGKKQWRRDVADAVAHLIAALQPSETVIGGGNVRLLKELPAGCRAGRNAHAFAGGFRLWAPAGPDPAQDTKSRAHSRTAQKNTGIQMLHETLGRRRAEKAAGRKSKPFAQLAQQIK
jgi:polyphosphate glucokinase